MWVAVTHNTAIIYTVYLQPSSQAFLIKRQTISVPPHCSCLIQTKTVLVFLYVDDLFIFVPTGPGAISNAI